MPASTDACHHIQRSLRKHRPSRACKCSSAHARSRRPPSAPAPDFWRNAWADASIYARFGLASPPWEGDSRHRLAESGQLLFDRARHFDVLQWLWLLNSHREVVYKALHGDKVPWAGGRTDWGARAGCGACMQRCKGSH
jgi:hypothetical protein